MSAYGEWTEQKTGGNLFTDFFGEKKEKAGGAAKKAKKVKETYKKTAKTVVGRDGVSRTLYTKGQKRYVKKKNSEGKFVYREVK